MRKLRILSLTLVLFMSMAGAAIGSKVTIYTDKTEWESALGGQFLTEDFTDELLGDRVYVSSESGNINTEFGCYQDIFMSASKNEPITIWTFTPQISAFGGNWTFAGPSGLGNSLLVYVDHLEQPVGIISSNSDFWGFISDMPFTSVLLVGVDCSNQTIYQLHYMVYSHIE